MYEELGRERLRTGEWLRVGVVEGPDAEWLPRVAPFLGHKPDQYRHHIRAALEGPLEGLETRFYVGTVDERLISQVMVVGDRRVGILGHVFTRPEERRKGACATILQHQMDHSRRLGYRALCLGTGFDSHPCHLYRRFGFQGVAPGNGCMRWLATPTVEEEIFAPGETDVRDGRWEDWAYGFLLSVRPVLPDEELPRNVTLGVRTQSSTEGAFLQFQRRREREPGLQLKVLVSAAGTPVGWAMLAPDLRWFREHWLLDVDVHPAFLDHLPKLIAALAWPEAEVVSYSTDPAGPRSRALRQAGFRMEESPAEWLTLPAGRGAVYRWRLDGTTAG